MTQSFCPVGYGRPPVHTRFQKGQSGNPGGKPGPKRRLKDEFDEALASALDGDRRELKEAWPKKTIEALARVLVSHALEGRPSAQKIVLARLEGKDGGKPETAVPIGDEEAGADESVNLADAEDAGKAAVAADNEVENENENENENDDEEEELTDQDRFVFDFARDMVGDRYDEIKGRIERAVNAGDMAALCDAVREAEDVRLKLAAEPKLNAMAHGTGQG